MERDILKLSSMRIRPALTTHCFSIIFKIRGFKFRIFFKELKTRLI